MKRKFNFKQWMLPALGIAVFFSCGSDENGYETPAVKEQTATLQLEISGEFPTADQTRALSFDTDLNIPRFINEDGITSWKTHCFLRKKGTTTQVYALVDWTATTAADGSITLNTKTSELTLLSSGSSTVTTPQAGETWYIAGIAGDGTLNADRTQVDFKYSSTKDVALEPHQVRVPLAFGWTPFVVAKASGERAPKITVTFRPQGSLLKVTVNNATNQGDAAVNSSIKIQTNALSTDGVFDYSTSVASVTDTAPVWKFTSDVATTTTLSRTISVSKGAEEVYVMWAYPRPESAKPSAGFSTETYINRFKTYEKGTTTTLPVRTKMFKSGIGYPMALDIDRPRMPLEYVAEYNVAEDGVSLLQTHSAYGNDQLSNAEYFTREQAVSKFTNITIEGTAYHLPTAREMAGIAPYRGVLALSPTSSYPADYETSGEYLQIEGETLGTFTNNLRASDFNTIYGLRFVNDTKDMVMAYRYQFVRIAGNEFNHCLVTSRYIGTKSVTLDDISKASYWTSNATDDCSRVFPMTGYLSEAAVMTSQLELGDYWTSSILDGSQYYYLQLMNKEGTRWVATTRSTIPSYGFAVRLFKDKM